MKSKEANVEIERMLSASGNEVLTRYRALGKSSATSYGLLLKNHLSNTGSEAVINYQLKGFFTSQDKIALRQVMRSPQYAIRSHKSFKGKEQARMEIIYNIDTYGWDVANHGNAELLVVDSLPHGYLRVFGAQVREGNVVVGEQVLEFSELEWLRNPDLIPGAMRQFYEQAVTQNEHYRITG